MIHDLSLSRSKRKSGGEYHDTRHDKTRDTRRRPERTVSLSDTARHATTDQRARFSLHDTAPVTRHPPPPAAATPPPTDQRAVRDSSVPPSFCDDAAAAAATAAARYVALYYLRRNSQRVVARRDVLVIHTSILSIWASRACSLRTCTSLWVAPLGVMVIASGTNGDRYFIHISKSIGIFVIYSFVVIWVIISCK